MAYAYYQKAAEQGMPGAITALQLITSSLGDKNSAANFEKTLSEAEARKDPNALLLQGTKHMFGEFGVEKNTDIAYSKLKEAADRNDLVSMYQLSQLLLEEMKRNEEGFNYCVKAADNGHRLAQQKLAMLYAYGHGCERDETKARRMAKRSREMNNENNDEEFDIEKIIVHGKNMCEFEAKNGLSSIGITCLERSSRYMEHMGDFQSEEMRQLFRDLDQYHLNPPVVSPMKPIKDYDPWLPQICKIAKEG
jgi:TPR repeat protein